MSDQYQVSSCQRCGRILGVYVEHPDFKTLCSVCEVLDNEETKALVDSFIKKEE